MLSKRLAEGSLRALDRNRIVIKLQDECTYRRAEVEEKEEKEEEGMEEEETEEEEGGGGGHSTSVEWWFSSTPCLDERVRGHAAHDALEVLVHAAEPLRRDWEIVLAMSYDAEYVIKGGSTCV